MLRLLILAVAAPLVAPTQEATAPRVPPTPWPELAFDPAQVDYDALIDPIGRGALEDLHVPGLSIAVMLGDELVFERGYGLANLEVESPAGAATVYRIGSVTKQFTAAAILGLVEDGKLALDDELGELLPWVDTRGRRITVHQLLDHTSGLPSYTDLGYEWLAHLREDVSPEDIWGWVAGKELDFEPGTDWHYNNTAYVLLGAILEEVGRRSPRMHLRRSVNKGLGLESIRYDNYKTVIAGRADGYSWNGLSHTNADFLSMTQSGPAGAIVATAADLLRWQHALVTGRVVGPESYAAMTTATVLPDGRSTGYGFGLAPGRMDGLRRISHGGGIMGFSSMLAYYPDVELGVCVLTNLEGVDGGAIERSVARQVLGLLPPLDIDLPVTEAQRAALVGTYRFLHFDLEVLDLDGQLVRRVPGNDEELRPLRHRGELAFGLDGDPSLLIRFHIGDNGLVHGATVEERGNELVGIRG